MEAFAATPLAPTRRAPDIALPFAVPFLGFCIVAASIISWKPIQLSIATVFLFAGPHNWIEFRYFLGRMPVRWGIAKLFYSVGLGGVALMAAGYILLYALGQAWYLNEAAWTVGTALWNTLMLLWVCALVYLRGREAKQADRSWIFAAGFALCAFVWVEPFWFSLGLVYVHPLVALWFLDRQLKRSRPAWRRAYHLCLAALPLIIVAMWLLLASSPNLPDDDALSWRITQHAGGGFLTGVSSHLLVATHVFLETIHYGAWLVMIPLIGLRGSIWRTNRIPLAVHRYGWPRIVRWGLALGVVVVLGLWVAFGLSYATTRDIYFTFAMAHVLAEAPFLIRLL